MKNSVLSQSLRQFFALFVAVAALAAANTQGQVLLEENFTFTGPLTGNGWTAFSGGGTAVINATAPGLTYPNLPSSGVGNAANLTASGEDLRKPLLAASISGDLYTSFLVNVSSATAGGDYFYSLYATTGGYFGRVFARSVGAGFQIGISKNSTTVAYDTTELAVGSTYLVVVKLTRNPGTGDDVASLWVNPALGGPETAALVSSTSGGDPGTIDNVALRQGSSTPVLRVGSVLVGTTWASVTPSADLPVITPSGGYTPFATFLGTASQSQSLTVGATSLTSSISASAPTGFEVSADNSSFGPSATLASTGGTLYARIAASATEGEIASSITLSSAGATDVAVAVSGAVRPTSIVLPYGPDTFESTAFPWYTYTAAGSRSWVRSSAGGNSFMEINGFDNAVGAVPANAWLILGPFDVPAGVSNIVATFNLQRAFNDLGDDSEFTFKYSTDYAGEGDPASATWSDIAFTKPAAVVSTSTDFTPSGAVPLPPTLAGQSGVYVAFQLAATSPTATSRWRMDQFELFTSSLPVISIVVNPTTVDEGSTASGTVSIPEAVGEDVIVTVTSADPTLVLVDNGYGDPPAGSCQVPIFAGETSASFTVTATRDFTPGADVPVQITADGGAAYTFGQTIVTVRNIDLPSASLTADGYTQDFAGFVSAETLPLGWALQGSVAAYLGDWGTGTSAGSRGNANVFGYQHTGSSGVVQQILTLRNDTGETITDVVVSYLGRVARATETRTPAYAVTVNGSAVPALAYSTASGSDTTVTAGVSGLSVAPGQTMVIAWTSDRGFVPNSGSSRQIGIGAMTVSIGSLLLPPSLSSLAVPVPNITRTTAEVSAEVTSNGGEAISAQGFVYAETSVNPDPRLGGAGVTDLATATTGVGPMSASLSGLTPATSYSIAAYATNAQGTTYTPVATFTTVSPAISFLGSYAEPFNNFLGSLPTGWSAISSGGVLIYGGTWGTGSSAGFRGGVSDPGVLGYQHTVASGTLTVTASFINDTGAPITTLYVKYLGRVARVDQTSPPSWAVSLDGTVIAELAYSTANTSGEGGTPGDELLSAAITGLNIPAGAEFDITWVSDRGSLGGSSRQIGLGNLQISTSQIPDPVVNVSGSLASFSATQGSPSSSQSFSASGTNLTGNITVTAPTDYEVSLDNSAFSASVTLPQASGTVASTPVYVRIAATAPAGNPAGQVSVTSFGATAQNIAVTGTVSAASGYDAWASGYNLDPATNGAPAADPDGDSFSNSEEYAFGTNPTLANGSLVEATNSGGNLVVSWLERSDVTYSVQSTVNLATTAFANDGTVAVVAGPTDPAPPAGYTRKQFSVLATGSKFYRVAATAVAP